MYAVRVALIDDHTMFREGLLGILSSREGIEVIGDSPTGEEALSLLRDERPDVVITQIDMDLHRAKEILARVREASPTPGSWCSPSSITSATCRPSPG